MTRTVAEAGRPGRQDPADLRGCAPSRLGVTYAPLASRRRSPARPAVGHAADGDLQQDGVFAIAITCWCQPGDAAPPSGQLSTS